MPVCTIGTSMPKRSQTRVRRARVRRGSRHRRQTRQRAAGSPTVSPDRPVGRLVGSMATAHRTLQPTSAPDWRAVAAVFLAPPVLAAPRLRHRRQLEVASLLCAAMYFEPHVVHHRRVPPLLRAPQLQDEPGVPVRPRLRRRRGRPEGRAVVGRPPPGPPPLHRHRARPALAAQGLLPVAHRLDRHRALVDHRLGRHRGLRQVPRAALPQQARLDRAVDARRGRVPHRRLARRGRRVPRRRPCCCGTPRSA